MEERSSHLTVVVGASTLAEDLRRLLVQCGVAHAGVATHLRGLRKSMLLGENDLVIVCIALDQNTLQRHGDSLRRLLADCHCFPQAVRSVGLLTEVGLTRDVADMGCDVYAHDTKQAANAVRLLARRWTRQRASATAARRARQRAETNRIAPNAWVWGNAKLPLEFASLMKPMGNHAGDASVSAVSRPRQTRVRRADHGRSPKRTPDKHPGFE